jgi:hypothetical protein
MVMRIGRIRENLGWVTLSGSVGIRENLSLFTMSGSIFALELAHWLIDQWGSGSGRGERKRVSL